MPRSPFLLLAALTLPLAAGDLEGVVKGPDGRPAPGAVVAATPESPNALSDGRRAARVARADAHGRFRLADLPAGAYGATATAPALGSAFLGKVGVPAAGAVKGLTFHLAAGPTIEGAAVDPGGKAAEGLQVFALRESPDSGDIFYAAVEAGRYRLALAPGTYTLVASAKGLEAAPAPLKVPGASLVRDFKLFPEKGSQPALADELAAMAHADQEIRERSNAHPDDQAIMKEWMAVDTRNESRLKEILKAYGWPAASLVGFRGVGAVWLMVQHASAPFLKECLPAMKAAAERGDIPWADVALSIDRDLMHDGKKQVYGSQFVPDEKGEMQPYPIEDEAHVDERRRAVGLGPFAEYAESLRRMYRH